MPDYSSLGCRTYINLYLNVYEIIRTPWSGQQIPILLGDSSKYINYLLAINMIKEL